MIVLIRLTKYGEYFIMEWENKFLQLYTATNLTDAKKAFELKRKNTPATEQSCRASRQTQGTTVHRQIL
jgi:hypothetical protein